MPHRAAPLLNLLSDELLAKVYIELVLKGRDGLASEAWNILRARLGEDGFFGAMAFIRRLREQ